MFPFMFTEICQSFDNRLSKQDKPVLVTGCLYVTMLVYTSAETKPAWTA